ncbi:MAG: threonine synthase [Bacteroidales bacterium]|nr:threonine synthase [Bacteroidales bacterium]
MTMEKYSYQCTDCGAESEASQLKYLCPDCSKSNIPELPPKGVLKTKYNYRKIIEEGVSFARLKQNNFIDLLPLNNIESLPNLRIGNTPLYKIDGLNKKKLPFHLFLKDDSQNPTYSFKDRASAVVSAFAKENAYTTIVTASTGNAGSSLAGICAAQGQKAVVIVPATAPLAKLTQILMYGARIVPVKGTYDDAFDLSIKATKAFGWYNRNTAFNPLTIEGKKTVAFELFEQLNFSVPDRIFVPVGDGVIISGVYKGFEDLLKLRLIDNMPTIVAVQAKKSDNLVRNMEKTVFEIKKSSTIADSIAVDIPRNFIMAKQYLTKYKGEHLTVSDDEIIEASSTLSKNTGLFAEPAAAAAFAGFLSYKNAGKLSNGSNNVVLLTGSGLKDLKAVGAVLKMPEAIFPSIENLKKVLS